MLDTHLILVYIIHMNTPTQEKPVATLQRIRDFIHIAPFHPTEISVSKEDIETGIRCMPHDCPIAHAALRVRETLFSGFNDWRNIRVQVGGFSIRFYYHDCYLCGGYCPAIVQRFIDRFDSWCRNVDDYKNTEPFSFKIQLTTNPV